MIIVITIDPSTTESIVTNNVTDALLDCELATAALVAELVASVSAERIMKSNSIIRNYIPVLELIANCVSKTGNK